MRQKLGQHFLTNKDVLQKIGSILSEHPVQTVVEIGPGHGELTDELLSAGGSRLRRIILLERDPELAEALRAKYRGDDRITIEEGDALETLPRRSADLQGENYALFGNIPYYLTGFLLRTISEMEHKPEIIAFTIQKEVAERICARPPQMNRLAAAVQFWAEPKVIGLISRRDFSPPPEVDSATILLRTLRKEDSGAAKYYRVLQALFKQPRKTVENNLSEGLGLSKEEVAIRLSLAGIKPGLRPQDLDLPEIRNLSSVIE